MSVENVSSVLFVALDVRAGAFAEAIGWMKRQTRRVYLPEDKLWVLDTGTLPTDPGWQTLLDDVKASGWHVLGFAAWPVDMPLSGNGPALRSLAELSVEAKFLQQRRK